MHAGGGSVMGEEVHRITAAVVTAAMLTLSVVMLGGAPWKAAVIFVLTAAFCCANTLRQWIQPLAVFALALALGVWLEFLPPVAEWRNTVVAVKP